MLILIWSQFANFRKKPLETIAANGPPIIIGASENLSNESTLILDGPQAQQPDFKKMKTIQVKVS